MKVDLRLPFLTRGKPRRCKDQRDILMAYQLSVDVPEISSRETETALRIETTVKSEMDVKGNVVASGRTELGVDIKAYDGMIYRYIGRPGAWLQEAFAGEKQSINPEFGSAISADPAKFTFNILGAALERHFEWQLERLSGVDSLLVGSWPMGSNPKNRSAARKTLFQDVEDKIDDLDMSVQSVSMEMLHTQARKLLLIDGELWVATKPPVWRVDVFDDGFTQFVTLAMAYGYEGLDRKLPRREFSIDDLDRAEAYFRKCAPRTNSERRTHRLTKSIPAVERSGATDFSWDADAAQMDRVGYALATEFSRIHTVHYKGQDDMVNEAVAAARTTNYILGDMAEVSHLTPTLCQLWKSTGYYSSFIDAGPAPARLARVVVDDIKDIVDNAPINIGIGSPGGLRF